MRRPTTLLLLLVPAIALLQGCPRHAIKPSPATTAHTAPPPVPANAPAPAPDGPITTEALARSLISDGQIVLRAIYFETAKATLLEASTPALIEVVTLLRANPQLSVEIGVHTDTTGSSTFNQAMSAQRASSIADWLTAQGVDSTRLTPVGYGESEPLDCGDSAECRAKCRRIELTALPDR